MESGFGGRKKKQSGEQKVVAEPVDIGKESKAPFVRLPEIASHFANRAARFAELAKDNPLGDYLTFMGHLAEAQQRALDVMQPANVPGAREMNFFREHQLAALDRTRWPRDKAWIGALRSIVGHMGKADGLPDAARQTLARLERMQDAGLDDLADRVLRDIVDGAEQGEALFITAALQVYWTRLAAMMDAAELVPNEAVVQCPICAAPPVAGIVHTGGNLNKTRYLCCSLCGTEWNFVRIKCASCQSTKGIAYHTVKGVAGPVKAETCDSCKTYTKVMYQELDPAAEPFADDLASVGLDILVGDAGWTRAHLNPFLLPDQGGD